MNQEQESAANTKPGIRSTVDVLVVNRFHLKSRWSTRHWIVFSVVWKDLRRKGPSPESDRVLVLDRLFPQVCHSKSGEVNSSKVANLVKAYVDKYKHARKKWSPAWRRPHGPIQLLKCNFLWLEFSLQTDNGEPTFPFLISLPFIEWWRFFSIDFHILLEK